MEKQVFNNKLYQEYLKGAKDVGFTLTRKPVTEEQLIKKESISPEDILGLRTYTERFFSTIDDNIFNLEIVRFTIKDAKNGSILLDLVSDNDLNFEGDDTPNSSFKIDNEVELNNHDLNLEVSRVKSENEVESSESGEETRGIIRYDFTPRILTKSLLTAKVEFKIGEKEVKNLRMIEMHFFKDKLLKIFDFTFGYCIPLSLNSWEHTYEIPKMPQAMVQEIENSPYQSRSETFYFANDKLIIHNKAEYSYTGRDGNWD